MSGPGVSVTGYCQDKLKKVFIMLKIEDKSQCCGCQACENICPVHAIRMVPDAEGFNYPAVDTDLCTDCGLCERICPEANGYRERAAGTCMAAKNSDEEIRSKSSSGGIFYALAEKVLEQYGGVVFGAVFDSSLRVVHSYTETVSGLWSFMGSKYVQSYMGNSYREAEVFLKHGRKVLFSGTPCQISGLRHFLRREYDNLLTVDVICHGVPSPEVWKRYIDYVDKGDHSNVSVNFRDKTKGWKNFSLVVERKSEVSGKGIGLVSEPFMENVYMGTFLADLSLRPSCYTCSFKKGRSGSDITLGDFWGISDIYPEFDDDKGCSCVIAYTEKARKFLSDIALVRIDVREEEIAAGNPSLAVPVKEPVNRGFFFHSFIRSNDVSDSFEACKSSQFYKRLRRIAYRHYMDMKIRFFR